MAILELELYIEWKHNFFNKINENGILKFRVHGITLKFKIIYYIATCMHLAEPPTTNKIAAFIQINYFYSFTGHRHIQQAKL